MKKLTIILCAICILGGSFSCSDMLETESTRQNIEPSIGDKTDSVFYAFGILQAMQQLADQYVFQGEMRGDLVKMTQYTDNNLRQLYNFTATTANKYDSAYVYYRVINNCNYYIAHCDTALYNGSTNVIIDKYAATKAIRAWAYLQLGRNYERVPFFTEPLTQISQIDRQYPELTLQELVAELAPDLEQYANMKVPSLGYTGTDAVAVGSPNWESTAKNIQPMICFIPVAVVLGDLYLEAGYYEQAARHYCNFLTKVADEGAIHSYFTAPMASKSIRTGRFATDDDLPDRSLMSASIETSTPWNTIFARNRKDDIITMIPMAVSAQNGQTTDVPLTFGFNYYATAEENVRSGAPYVDEIQLLPSDALNLLSDSTEYYFYARNESNDPFDSTRVANCGDMRLRSILHQELNGDSTLQWIDKYKYANIILYRYSTVWLHLAEAFNRLGMPDAAFAILKDGVSGQMLERYADGSYKMAYLTDDSRNRLLNDFQLLSTENLNRFTDNQAMGIHVHGAGKATSDYPGLSGATGGTEYHTGKSPYQLDRMVGKKMDELAEQLQVTIGATRQDTINAVEDLLCDEYALELAFEGNRYFDLLRMARHKNESGLYGADFGSRWLTKKLEAADRHVDMTDRKNWYLPFK